ncbi:hypothetical protein HanXRQr2_Chr08g0359441 [Helianthus annuus]|uniref:Uncharacterized protein n=1 Tax=Helianthus annuus TaxID=4232 RepID=A0A251U877_HELAN|nr:hypothetical protein HanXRQr2_Chr08g0359441 [Helianthus annuus]KAJ0959386.1 hypothetical protein HanPSC8_Chr00c139g0805111 [Helianthus annuus]
MNICCRNSSLWFLIEVNSSGHLGFLYCSITSARCIRPLGAYHWNLLSVRLEWSWVEIHGIATQD